jgi:hypothetical protein
MVRVNGIARGRSLVIVFVAAVLVAATAGLANAHGTEQITAETWVTSTGYVKGQIRYTLGVEHYTVCAVAYLGYNTPDGKWQYSGKSASNCNNNHWVKTAQATATVTAPCPRSGDVLWQVRGFAEAYSQNNTLQHREPDYNYKWGNAVTVHCP